MLIHGEPKYYHHIFYHYIDFIYGIWLTIHKKWKTVSNDDLFLIRQISEQAFTEVENPFECVTNIKQLKYFCGCSLPSQIEGMIFDNECYLLLSHHYNCIFLHMAGAIPHSTAFLKEIPFLYKRCGNKTVYALCREKTSYRIIKAYEKRKRLVVLYDQTRISSGDLVHLVKLKGMTESKK